MNTKEIIGIITVVLGIFAYAPYLRDVVRGTTKPHIFTWIVGSLVASTIFALQVSGGAHAGAWVTGTIALVNITITILSIRNGFGMVTRNDIVIFAFALAGLCLWLVVDEPMLSTILLVSVGIAGFFPTIRKSWHAPYTETLSTYAINAFRHALSFFALAHYSIVTGFFPGAWVLINIAFCCVLIVRRKSTETLGRS